MSAHAPVMSAPNGANLESAASPPRRGALDLATAVRELASMPTAIPSSTQRHAWLHKAAELRQEPRMRTVIPTVVVEAVQDPAAWQGWRMDPVGDVKELVLKQFKRGAIIHIDLGEHLVGQPEFGFGSAGNPPDSPLRIRIRVSELPAEAADPDRSITGSISSCWHQDETVTLDEIPTTYRMPRRLAGRWLTLEVIDTAPNWRLTITAVRFHAVTGAAHELPPPPAGLSPTLAGIDQVAMRTLRNCMQTVYEDGPKRDRRLWTGDLRLQLLADGVGFHRIALAERSLCLLAAFTRESDGAFPACCFERPAPHAAADVITDYCLALPAILCELLRQGGNRSLIEDLAPLARHQIAIALEWLGPDETVIPPAGWWTFIDWKDGLDKRAPLHGVLCWALDSWLELAGKLQIPVGEDVALIALLRASGRATFCADGTVTSNAQKSWAATAWMVLGKIITGDEARTALATTLADPAALTPGGPYLMHQVVHALWVVGERERALALITEFWGGMVACGADVFWEVYDPAAPLRSPYNDFRLNSACHAWSCTPSWFLRAPERAGRTA